MGDAVIRGLAYWVPDCVDTDVMSPGRFEPYEGPEQLARIALIDYESDVPFVDEATGRSAYTVIFAGREFGCGSSRETAPQALHHAGARVVVAPSFGQIFFRNCVNMGLLLPVVCDHGLDRSVIGEEVIVDLHERTVVCGGRTLVFADFGPLGAIVDAGGLTNYTKQREARSPRAPSGAASEPS